MAVTRIPPIFDDDVPYGKSPKSDTPIYRVDLNRPVLMSSGSGPLAVDIFFLGARGVMTNMDILARVSRDTTQRELWQLATRIMARSKESFVPEYFGHLKESGHVSFKERSDKEDEIILSYGGTVGVVGQERSVKYAAAVHEHPSVYSPPRWRKHGFVKIIFRPPGTGPKYLEKPLMEAASKIAPQLGDTLRQSIAQSMRFPKVKQEGVIGFLDPEPEPGRPVRPRGKSPRKGPRSGPPRGFPRGGD